MWSRLADRIDVHGVGSCIQTGYSEVVDRYSASPSAQQPMKILLLTPYTGGNLGDAAIQEAAIAGIRKRLPNVDLLLVTLSPDDTSRVHGVPSFPIGVTTFGPGIPVGDEAASSGGDQTQNTIDARRRVTADRILRALRERAARAGRVIMYWTGILEIGHIIRAFMAMRSASMLIVSGGGQLDDYWGGPFRQPYALLKWALIARASGARVVFLSVGTCSLSRLSRALVRVALSLASYRSFRDEGSKSLASFAPCTAHDEVQPDLAFSYEVPATVRTEGTRRRDVVLGVSPIAYLSRIWPETNQVVYTRYLQSLASTIKDAAAHGHQILVFTSDPVDWAAVSDLNALVRSAVGPLSARQVVIRETFTLEGFFAQIAECDLFVASRLHGVLLANLVSTPTLAISYDRKVDAYMHEMELTKFCVDIRSVSHTVLMSRLGELAAEAEAVRSHLSEVVRANRRRLEAQYDHILADLRPRRSRRAASVHANPHLGYEQSVDEGAPSANTGLEPSPLWDAKPYRHTNGGDK